MNKNILERFLAALAHQRAVHLLATLLFYFLGIGILRYTGQPVDRGNVFFGLGCVVLFLLSGFFLQVYFDPLFEESETNKTLTTPKDGDRHKLLYAGLATLAVSSVPAYFLVIIQNASNTAVLFLVLLFILIIAYSVPPFMLAAKGYGELTLTVWIAVLVPAFALLLQGNPINLLISMLTFPLAVLYLAMLISTSLQKYLNDMIRSRKTLTLMVGWKFAMDLHNGLIFTAYLLIAVVSLFGLPWNLTWPLLLPAPIFLFTVYEILRIKSGTKPRWALLTLSGYAGIGCMLYVLLFTLWIR